MNTSRRTNSAVVDKARRLIQRGRAEEARTLLLEARFSKGLDNAAQNAFLKMFPPNPAFKAQLDGPLRRLHDSDPAVRLKATRLTRGKLGLSRQEAPREEQYFC
jgi:hypothetical protein